MNFSLFSSLSLTNVGNQRWSSSDATVSLTLLEKVFPRAASGIVTPVSHPDNLRAAVWIMFCCVFSITVLTFLFCLGLGSVGVFWVMEGKDVWRSNSLVFSFFSVPDWGLGSVKSGTGAASVHNLALRDGVIGVQWGYFTIISMFFSVLLVHHINFTLSNFEFLLYPFK